MSMDEYNGEQIRRQQPENRAQGAISGAGTVDPWTNRSSGMKCRTCIWFVTKETSFITKPDVQIVGRCRRHAPTMGGYPVVYQTDWCGDHRIDENKI